MSGTEQQPTAEITLRWPGEETEELSDVVSFQHCRTDEDVVSVEYADGGDDVFTGRPLLVTNFELEAGVDDDV